MAALKINVAGSLELAGRLLLKLSADFAFQNFFSKSSVDLFIFLNNLNLSKSKPRKIWNLLLVEQSQILLQSQLLKIGSTTKSLTPRLDQQLEQQYLVPLRLITFRMCHEFGVFNQKY